jgi:ribose/xylose/arabinose/galactoside ABC-type transport system permease subunit
MDRLMHLRESLGESPEIVAFVTLLVVFIFFAFAAPNFLTAFALSNILTFASVFGIVVVGVAFLMISGEFDLSVGSVLAVA